MRGEGFLLEVCVDSLHGALEAERGGAGRLELCGSIHATGGVTPSYGLMKLVKSRVRIPVHVLIRPRAGDFVYSDLDLDVMQADIHTVAQFGFQGVAIGALTPSRDIDVKAMHLLLQECQRYNLSVTFHRAFDCVVEPLKALKLISSLGNVSRVLTSGQERTVVEGVPLLRALMAETGSSMSILPGAGITEANASYVVNQLGVSELHGSVRKELHVSPLQSLLPGDKNSVIWTVDADKVSRGSTSRGVLQWLYVRSCLTLVKNMNVIPLSRSANREGASLAGTVSSIENESSSRPSDADAGLGSFGLKLESSEALQRRKGTCRPAHTTLTISN